MDNSACERESLTQTVQPDLIPTDQRPFYSRLTSNQRSSSLSRCASTSTSINTADGPDGGFWAWIVVLGSFLANGIIFGSINCFGILFDAIKQKYVANNENAKFLTCE